ncbi:hypothetical protein ACMC56_02575 [Campylobacterota bacterium DY0563]
MSGTLIIREEFELEINENKPSDINLATFSGYIAFTGEIAEQFAYQVGKKINLIAKVVDGVTPQRMK